MKNENIKCSKEQVWETDGQTDWQTDDGELIPM